MKPNDVFDEVVEETKERTSHIDIDVSSIPSQVKEGLLGHTWKQQGPYLICTSCPISHAISIGVNRIYLGSDDKGMPKFKKIG